MLADLRQLGGWITAIALVSLVISTLATYYAVFAATEIRSGAVSAGPPGDSLSFLRAIDPNESMITVVESLDDLDQSVLDEPGLAVLLDRMERDGRMFIALPLNAFLLTGRSPSTVDSRVTAVVGSEPPFLDRAPHGDGGLLWGSLGDVSDPAVNDTAIRGHALEQLSTRPPDTTYLAGSGLRAPESIALVAFSVTTARDLGVAHPYDVSEVVRGFSCYCDVTELADVANEMSDAESRAATGRAYYAVDRERAIGPVQRSRSLAESFNAGHGIGVFLAVWCMVVMVAQVFWVRRSPVYLVERLAGSSEIGIQVRAQLLIALSLTLPSLAGYELVDAMLRTAAWPPPLPLHSRVLVIGAVILLHSLAGGILAIRVHRLCRFAKVDA